MGATKDVDGSNVGAGGIRVDNGDGDDDDDDGDGDDDGDHDDHDNDDDDTDIDDHDDQVSNDAVGVDVVDVADRRRRRRSSSCQNNFVFNDVATNFGLLLIAR